MANYYVRSGATGSANGTSWANAYLTLVSAFTGKAAGDVFWVADDHAETQASALTIVSPGTAANPCRVLCVNTHTTEPPTALASTASISTTGANNLSLQGGFTLVSGIRFSSGSGAVTAHLNIGSSVSGWTLVNCALVLANTGASSRISLGANSIVQARVSLVNTSVTFNNASQSITLNQASVEWSNTASAVQGTVPTLLLAPANQTYFNCWGLDLSALGSGKSLVNANLSVNVSRLWFRNCKLGASVSAISGTIPSWGASEVYIDNCDSGSTNYRMEHYKYQGSIKQETSKVRTADGASDGTTPISHNFTTLASGPSLFNPLEGPWMTVWNETVGSPRTVTVEVCPAENLSLYDDECWLEVEYLGTTGFPQSVYASSRVADAFATHGLLTTSAASWSGFSTPAPQKLSLTFTPQSKGPIRARVCVAKASTTVYVDPLLTVS